MRGYRSKTSIAQSEAARQNGKKGKRPIDVCPAGHRRRKDVRWVQGKAQRVCPLCHDEPSNFKSNWKRFFPDLWKLVLCEGRDLIAYSFSARRGMQRSFGSNTQDEQDALDASLIQEICHHHGYELHEIEGATCGQIVNWASHCC